MENQITYLIGIIQASAGREGSHFGDIECGVYTIPVVEKVATMLPWINQVITGDGFSPVPPATTMIFSLHPRKSRQARHQKHQENIEIMIKSIDEP